MTALTTERLDEVEQDPIEACLTDDEIIELISAARSNAKLVEALKLVQRGIRLGKIKDQTLLPKPKPTDTSIDTIALSSVIDAALEAAGIKP